MRHFTLLLLAVCACLTGSAQKPTLTSHTPITGALQVLTSVPISLSFNKAVTKGTGNIYLRNRTLKFTTTIAASSANVSASGSFVTISGLGLIAGCYYHVTFDSTAFDSSSYHSTGLYDTSLWWFRTGGTGVGVGNVNPSALSVRLIANAANGLFVISCNMPHAAMLAVRIYDMNGYEAAVKSFYAQQGDNDFSLQTDLPPGTYIIKVDDGRSVGLVRTSMQ